MKNKPLPILQNFRAIYSKLFSGLCKQYGQHHAALIEDSIQTAFYKLLKLSQSGELPEKIDAWLFVVAKNQLINQLKKTGRYTDLQEESVYFDHFESERDQRLSLMIFIVEETQLTSVSKTLFILKYIFGLSIKEISQITLFSEEAIYKNVRRTREKFSKPKSFIDEYSLKADNLRILENILYSVYTLGYDSFDSKKKGLVNEDLCLEALSLAKLLFKEQQATSTANLIALFCFHSTRISARVTEGGLIPFFDQDREKWNKDLLTIGFNYLTIPAVLDRFYIEALISSKYMTTNTYNLAFWGEILSLYKMLEKSTGFSLHVASQAYCLHQMGRTSEALILLKELEKQFKISNSYLPMIKSHILKSTDPEKSRYYAKEFLDQLEQAERKSFIQSYIQSLDT